MQVKYRKRLAEVNLARGAATSQSSTHNGGVSSRAVDGNYATEWSSGSCSSTGYYDTNPSWTVEFKKRVTVNKVEYISLHILINAQLLFFSMLDREKYKESTIDA